MDGRLEEISDNNDLNPLHISVFKDHLKVVETLLLSGAKVNVADHFGLTPLHLSAMTGNMEVSNYVPVRILNVLS